jgi:hypothetical protein
MLGRGFNNRPVHVVCAPKAELLFIVTVYVPGTDVWDDVFRARRQL